MARQKRVPHKPDAFQKQAQVVASWLLDRGTIIGMSLVLIIVAIIVGALVSRSSAKADEKGWTAYYKAAGDIEKLEGLLEGQSSGSSRPFALLALASARLEAPADDEGKPKKETEEERAARLKKAEEPLREITKEYPDHYLNIYALMLLGELLEERGEYTQAVEMFQKAIASETGTLEPKLHYDIGRNLFLAGKTEEARLPLERAKELSTKILYIPERYGQRPTPTKPLYRENAEYLLAKIGRGERAVVQPEKPAQVEKPQADEPGDADAETAKPATEKPDAQKATGEKAPEQKPAESGDAAAAPADEKPGD
jgi:tetratricopeptide (TPR) repeat protein